MTAEARQMALLRRYDELLDQLLVDMKEHYGSRLVACAVFGSVGRGTPRYESDIDLLIVARDLPRGRLNRVEEVDRSEERRVGKECRALCRSRWSPYH